MRAFAGPLLPQLSVSSQTVPAAKRPGALARARSHLTPITFTSSDYWTFRDPPAPVCRVPETVAGWEPAPPSCGG